jgi:hypothetical protein
VAAAYVIEEKLLINGVFSGPLAHDRNNNQSISVYTGSKYSGGGAVSPSLCPARCLAACDQDFCRVPEVYVPKLRVTR